MLYLRSFNRFIFISLALLGLSISSVNAALVTQLHGVNVNGRVYDVTFHGASFNALRDGDGELIFGDGDGSQFGAAPTFWGGAGWCICGC